MVLAQRKKLFVPPIIKPPTTSTIQHGVRPKTEDPLNPSRVRGYAQMLECWMNRQPQCFWDNFWFVNFETQYTKCDARYGPSLDATCGSYPLGTAARQKCDNRRIFSGYCKVNDENLFVKWTQPEAGQRVYCKNATLTSLVNNCNTACGSLSPAHNKVEAGGCDGYTAWCWCNSTIGGGINQLNQNSHCTCTEYDSGGQCVASNCGAPAPS